MLANVLAVPEVLLPAPGQELFLVLWLVLFSVVSPVKEPEIFLLFV